MIFSKIDATYALRQVAVEWLGAGAPAFWVRRRASRGRQLLVGVWIGYLTWKLVRPDGGSRALASTHVL